MSTRHLLAAALSLACATASVGAWAADRSVRIDKRSAHQEQRIDAGVRSGELTGREAARLERGQTHVNRLESRAEADGRIGAREAARIERAQDHQSKRIYRQKHDRQTRG